MNDTVEYLEDESSVAAPPPAKKARKGPHKTEAASQTSAKKIGLNKLDLIERAIRRIQQAISDRGIPIKEDVLDMVRRRLLEYCFRGDSIEISVITERSEESVAQILARSFCPF